MIGQVTVFESPSLLAKTWSIEDGEPVKVVAAEMYRGTFSVRSFGDVEALVELLDTITTRQALCTSLPFDGRESGAVTTKAASRLGALARVKENFPLKALPGLLFIDCDDGSMGRDELWEGLTDAVPALAASGAVWRPSGSSFIFNGDKVVNGLRGQHIAIMVRDASDAPRVTKILAARQWLEGHGRVEVSASGSMVLRCPIDTAVAQPARLLFVGGAHCEAPLEQRRGPPVVLGHGGFLDTRLAVPDLTDDEQARYEVFVEQAKAAALPEAMQKREALRRDTVARRVPELMKQGVSAADAEARVSAAVDSAYNKILLADQELTLVDEDGTHRVVTVGQVLADRERFHDADCLDPLNPGHRGGAADCRLYLLSTSPIAFSFDGGGQVYRLRVAKRTFVVAQGARGELVLQLANAISEDASVFLTDTGPVVIDEGRQRKLTVERLMGLVARDIVLVKQSAKGQQPTDLAKDTALLVLAGVTQ